MNQKDPFRQRRLVVLVLLLAGFTLVFVRLVHLQVIQAHELTTKVRRQHHKVFTIEGRRGAIYDRHGKVLALNLDVPSVYGMPSAVDNARMTARRLSALVELPASDIRRRLEDDRHFVWIKRKADPALEHQLDLEAMEGIGVVMESRRVYPNGSLLSHILGFTGVDNQGLEGVEQRYDTYLQGQSETVMLQRDALGRPVLPPEAQGAGQRTSLAGHNVTLTIDEHIQYIVERELGQAIDSTEAKSGIVVVMDPRTGEILALALRPTFDPNRFQQTSPSVWRNRAVTDTYEPGSTLKMFVAAAALEEDLVEPGTLIYGGEGEMVVANTTIHDHEKAGWMTFAHVIERSSNVGAIKTAFSLGKERFYQYLKAFGFGESSQIDVSGETPGLVKDPTRWGRRTLASVAIGQEVGVTPIQLVSAISAVANGGWLMQPFVVSRIQDSQGRVVLEQPPQIRRRPVSSTTAKVLTGLLERAVEQGTGKRASIPGYRVAGKTGTAQKFDVSADRYSSTKLIGSFVGFVPVEQPRLAILVIIDEPQTVGWGGVVAAPVFRRIAEQVLTYLGVTSHDNRGMAVTASWPSGRLTTDGAATVHR